MLCFFIFDISCTLIPSDEEKIKSKIDVFCTAYNNGELEDAIDCLDAKSRNKLNKTISLTQGVLGLFGVSVDLDQLLKDLWGVSVLMISDENLLTIEIFEIEIENDTALVRGRMKYEDYMTSSDNQVYITMVQEKDDWFIKDIDEIETTIEKEN